MGGRSSRVWGEVVRCGWPVGGVAAVVAWTKIWSHRLESVTLRVPRASHAWRPRAPVTSRLRANARLLL